MSASSHRNPLYISLFVRSASALVRPSRLAPIVETWAGDSGRTVHDKDASRLSPTGVSSAKTPGYIVDGGKLYLRVALGTKMGHKGSSVSKGWIFASQWRAGLAISALALPTISLAKAREVAAHYRQLVAAGIDPLEARNEERQAALVAAAKAVTFEQCATAFIGAHEAGWRKRAKKLAPLDHVAQNLVRWMTTRSSADFKAGELLPPVFTKHFGIERAGYTTNASARSMSRACIQSVT